MRGHRLDGNLPILRCVADVARIRPDDGGKALLQRDDHIARVAHGKRCLRDVGRLFRLTDDQLLDLGRRRHDVQVTGNLPARALHLRVAGMADQDHVIALRGVALALHVHLAHERACRVDHVEPPAACVILHGAGDAMC
jgi:hypothetical protein